MFKRVEVQHPISVTIVGSKMVSYRRVTNVFYVLGMRAWSTKNLIVL